LYVSATAKTSPTCTLSSNSHPFPTIAGALACAGSGDEIKIGKGTFVGGFSVTGNVTIAGAGAATVIDDPGTALGTPLITIGSPNFVQLSNFTLNGNENEAGIVAGSGSLTVSKVTVENAVSNGEGASLDVAPTAGSAQVTVLDSTFGNGYALGNAGGGISVSSASSLPASTLQIADSTLSDNQTGGVGGGIYATNTAVTLFNDTIAGNSALTGGGIDVADTDSSLTLGNDLIASNVAQGGIPDCLAPGGAIVDDDGHNLLSQPGLGDCDTLVNGQNGDQVGTTSDPIIPQLGPLAANGGSTPTQALLTGSPAIAAGSVSICQAAPVNGLDQRGDPRNETTRSACDVGAYDTGGV
jgi:hypothetical protein